MPPLTAGPTRDAASESEGKQKQAASTQDDRRTEREMTGGTGVSFRVLQSLNSWRVVLLALVSGWIAGGD
jgi:dipeptide/tripeptide permease